MVGVSFEKKKKCGFFMIIFFSFSLLAVESGCSLTDSGWLGLLVIQTDILLVNNFFSVVNKYDTGG